MSIWDSLLGGAAAIGGVVAAPFTGGASLGLTAGGLGLIGAGLGADASKSAANQQAQAQQNQLAFQQQQWQQTQQNLSPYLQQGLQYQSQLANQMPQLTHQYNYSDYMNSPEYINALQAAKTGQQGLTAQGAASGMLGSGNMASALQANAMQQAQAGYGQGMQDYWGQNQNVYNMLSPLAAQGQNAEAGLGGLSQNASNQIGGTMAGIGSTQAQGTIGQANALSGGLSNAGNQLMGAFGYLGRAVHS